MTHDSEDGGTCNVCGGGVRYGDRHRTCGATVMQLEHEISLLRERAQALVRALDTPHGYSDDLRASEIDARKAEIRNAKESLRAALVPSPAKGEAAQVNIPYLLTSDRACMAEIHGLRAKTGQRTMTDGELIDYCVWLGLQSELETMRFIAGAFEKREEQTARGEQP